MPRYLVLLIGLYVSMDLANPWMPGAFVFDPDGSVDGLSARRDGVSTLDVGGSASDLTLKRRFPPMRLASVPNAPRARLQTEWVGEVRRAHTPTPELTPPGEDH
jgi:hypothetical protein